MKTQRRWLKSVIAAAATEEVSLPWAAGRTAKQGAVIAHTLPAQPQTAPRPYPYAIAAR